MKPISLSPGAAFAIDRLESRGYECYAVGGCVRDSLLGFAPHDWDLTTSATPPEIKAAFADCRVIETGIQHGTVTVLYQKEPLEITTFRKDGAYADNRHPTAVTFSETVEEDLSRRDFTVNAMAYNPEKGLIDLFDGRGDLKKKLIRCVGNAETRFNEDGLRILRAVRFASALGFALEKETARAVRNCACLLDGIAKERVREEFSKLILGKTPTAILRDYPEVFARFLPEIVPFKPQTLEFLSVAPLDLPLRLSLLFCSADQAKAALLRLRYDNETQKETVDLIGLQAGISDFGTVGLRRLLRDYPAETVKRLLAVSECKGADMREAKKTLQAILSRGDCTSLSTLAVSGKDLIALGIPAGKRVGNVLETLLDRVIDGSLQNEKAALLAAAKALTK